VKECTRHLCAPGCSERRCIGTETVKASDHEVGLDGWQKDDGVDPTHVVLGAMLSAETVIAIVGFADLRRRSEKQQGVHAATFLARRRLDEFVRSSGQSSSRPDGAG
jgi:hypothetical protein